MGQCYESALCTDTKSGYDDCSDTFGPDCPPDAAGCEWLSDRAKAIDYDGDGRFDFIALSGTFTSGNPFADIADNITAWRNLHGWGSYSTTTTAVAMFVMTDDRIDHSNLVVAGHSLGAAEITILANLLPDKFFKEMWALAPPVYVPPHALVANTVNYMNPGDLVTNTMIVWEDGGVEPSFPIDDATAAGANVIQTHCSGLGINEHDRHDCYQSQLPSPYWYPDNQW
jgi:hypothetical protein